jgi:hypothetical protein
VTGGRLKNTPDEDAAAWLKNHEKGRNLTPDADRCIEAIMTTQQIICGIICG